jgi:hypothetical protein
VRKVAHLRTLLLTAVLLGGAAASWAADGPDAEALPVSLEEGQRLLRSVEEDFFLGRSNIADLRRRLDRSAQIFGGISVPCEREFWSARTSFFHAMIDEFEEQWKSAERRFEETEELASQYVGCRSSSEGLRLLADTYSRLTKYRGIGYKAKKGPQVKTLSESAIEIDGTNSRAYLTLALYHLHAPGIAGGSVKKSLTLLHLIEEMEDLEPLDRYSVLLWLAIAHHQNKDQDASGRYLDLALDMYPRNPWVDSLLADYGL